MSKPRNAGKPRSRTPPEAPPEAPEPKIPVARSTRASKHRKQPHVVDGGARRSMIAEAVYSRAERRNSVDRSVFDDGIEAENQIDRLLDLDSER